MDTEDFDSVIRTVGIETIHLRNETLLYRIFPPAPAGRPGYTISCNAQWKPGRYEDPEAARWACHLDAHGIIDLHKVPTYILAAKQDQPADTQTITQEDLERLVDFLATPTPGADIQACQLIRYTRIFDSKLTAAWAVSLVSAGVVNLEQAVELSGQEKIQAEHLRQALVTADRPPWF